MSLMSRKISYSSAINEALHQMMLTDERIFLIGQGVKSPWYVGNTCKGLLERFGPERVIDTPVSENAITGAAAGAAVAGMRPVVVHPRMDFMLYAMDPIINQAANWSYMFGGRLNVPIVIWGIINRGGEQAAQHSQVFHALFSHIPGLKVVMPATPYDAKGLMISAIKDNNPVIFIDDRRLYGIEGEAPKEIYSVPLGKGVIRREGSDISVITISYMVGEADKAAKHLVKEGIEIEIIDLRTTKPLDRSLLLKSVRKTGRVLIADVGWLSYGLSAEISAFVSENAFRFLKKPIKRIALVDSPAPASSVLEKRYYPNYLNIIRTAKELMRG